MTRIGSAVVDGVPCVVVVDAAGTTVRPTDIVPDLGAALSGDLLDDAVSTALAAPSLPIDEVVWRPTIPRPPKILCVGLNYRLHVEESASIASAAGHPTIFTRFPSSHVGHLQALVAPSASDTFDYEGEVGVVIGRPGRHIRADDAMEHVIGLTPFMDGSVREFQRHTSQFTPGKNFDDSGSFGPWMTTLDEIEDLDAVTVTTRVDGEQVQHAPLAELITSIPDLIAYCSTFTTLEPGDVIATGTPGGVGIARDPQLLLRAGMTVEVEVSGVGTLRNPVIAES
ncbi:MAG: fumarylacetoacetate hydrolase family protein [Actinomycetota bacterium]